MRDVDDAALERARATIAQQPRRASSRRSGCPQDEADAVLARIAFTTDVAQAVAGADVVIEAVPEIADLKHEVWSEVVEHAPADALLGTNTSQLSITSIGAGLGDAAAARLVGMHFFNPPVMMRLVEVIAGTLTDPAHVERAREFATTSARRSWSAARTAPGFITSRAYAILRLECIRMLEEGVATAEDIDTALKLGFNFPMGPLELGDMNGLDTYLQAISRSRRGARRPVPADGRPAQHGRGRPARAQVRRGLLRLRRR